jgi:hypothetical protein
VADVVIPRNNHADNESGPADIRPGQSTRKLYRRSEDEDGKGYTFSEGIMGVTKLTGARNEKSCWQELSRYVAGPGGRGSNYSAASQMTGPHGSSTQNDPVVAASIT